MITIVWWAQRVFAPILASRWLSCWLASFSFSLLHSLSLFLSPHLSFTLLHSPFLLLLFPRHLLIQPRAPKSRPLWMKILRSYFVLYNYPDPMKHILFALFPTNAFVIQESTLSLCGFFSCSVLSLDFDRLVHVRSSWQRFRPKIRQSKGRHFDRCYKYQIDTEPSQR